MQYQQNGQRGGQNGQRAGQAGQSFILRAITHCHCGSCAHIEKPMPKRTKCAKMVSRFKIILQIVDGIAFTEADKIQFQNGRTTGGQRGGQNGQPFFVDGKSLNMQ